MSVGGKKPRIKKTKKKKQSEEDVRNLFRSKYENAAVKDRTVTDIRNLLSFLMNLNHTWKISLIISKNLIHGKNS